MADRDALWIHTFTDQQRPLLESHGTAFGMGDNWKSGFLSGSGCCPQDGLFYSRNAIHARGHLDYPGLTDALSYFLHESVIQLITNVADPASTPLLQVSPLTHIFGISASGADDMDLQLFGYLFQDIDIPV